MQNFKLLALKTVVGGVGEYPDGQISFRFGSRNIR